MENSELDRKIEQAINLTCEAIATVMSEVIWDSDQMIDRHPTRLFTLLARGGKLMLIIARAHHLLAEVRCKASVVEKEKALAQLTTAKQKLEKAKFGVAKSIRV